MQGLKSLPTVVAARDGTVAISVLEYEGTDRLGMRDAIGYYFTVKLSPEEQESRVAVVFSGTVYSVSPTAFGLPGSGSREQNFKAFALAAMGDHLDEHGLPDFTPSGDSAAKIDAFSPQFQSWADREPADDDAVERYIKAHLFWSWRYNLEGWELGGLDELRLGRSDCERIARLYHEDVWTISTTSPRGLYLKPSPAFLREEKERSREAREEQQPVASSVMAGAAPPDFVYVDEARIGALRQVENARFDLRKLLAICEELNLCYRSQCYHAVAALTRSLMDHVPPIFECASFTEVANNYDGGRSFKECMQRLEGAARKIADSHLHTQIRSSESLPTRTQVDFSNEMDWLLAEIIRILE